MQSSEKVEFKNFLEQGGVIDALTKGTTRQSISNRVADSYLAFDRCINQNTKHQCSIGDAL
jgi:hypothetical protein